MLLLGPGACLKGYSASLCYSVFHLFLFYLICQRHVVRFSLLPTDGGSFRKEQCSHVPTACVCLQSLNTSRYLSAIGA